MLSFPLISLAPHLDLSRIRTDVTIDKADLPDCTLEALTGLIEQDLRSTTLLRDCIEQGQQRNPYKKATDQLTVVVPNHMEQKIFNPMLRLLERYDEYIEELKCEDDIEEKYAREAELGRGGGEPIYRKQR